MKGVNFLEVRRWSEAPGICVILEVLVKDCEVAYTLRRALFDSRPTFRSLAIWQIALLSFLQRI